MAGLDVVGQAARGFIISRQRVTAYTARRSAQKAARSRLAVKLSARSM